MTVQELISLARGHFEGFDSGEALVFLQAVHNDLLRRVRVRPDSALDVDLVAGTGRYALPSDVLRIWDAAYVASSSESSPLRAKSVDELDSEDGGTWRRASTGMPLSYDERAGEVWLSPTPSLSTTDGYPKVVLQVTRTTALAMSDALPTAVPDWEAWLYGLCRRYAAMKSPASVQMFLALEKDAVERLQRFSLGKAARGRPVVRGRVPRIRTV